VTGGGGGTTNGGGGGGVGAPGLDDGGEELPTNGGGIDWPPAPVAPYPRCRAYCFIESLIR